MTQPSPKRVTNKFMQILIFSIYTLFFTAAHAQENTLQASQASIKIAELSESELLKQAKSLKYSDIPLSIELANKALKLSNDNNNLNKSAQAHTLLGKLTEKNNNITQSIKHFYQASLIYKRLGDQREQIKSSLYYANVFFTAKRYDEANKIIDELLLVAQEYGDELYIAKTLVIKGNGYYQQEHYNDAIVQFSNAMTYLSGESKATKKQLAQTYKKIAQSYKRLKDKKQTVSFYKKTLAIYTELDDKKSIANNLHNLSTAERNQGNYVIALDYSMRALEIHEQIDDPEGRAKALLGTGIIYRHIGRYEKSLNYVHEAHLYYKAVNNISAMLNTSNQMGFVYTRLKKFQQARSFYQLTIDLPEEKVEPKDLATALREMAVIDLNSGNYASAMMMAKKSHNIYKELNEKSKCSITARIIGNIYYAQDNETQDRATQNGRTQKGLTQHNLDQNNHARAIAYYEESLALATEIGHKTYQAKALTYLGRAFLTDNIDKAVELLKKSLKLSTEIDYKSQKLDAYNLLRKAEKIRGNVSESLRYAEKEISLTRVIQRERENDELILAKANLHSYKIEMELESLKEKAKLDQLELTKKNSEIAIAEQAGLIAELELTKNQYASIALASLLAICLSAVVFIYRKFSNSKKRNKELNYLAARDPLTNCYNRRILFDFINRDFANPERLGEYCIILVDIDHFKAVNDTYGHSMGDSVLREVAAILQASVRKNDIVARFGGEEFCIVLPSASQDQAMRIAEAMRLEVENSQFDDIKTTCSFGVSSIKFNAKDPTELIDQADIALFKSKSSGRNLVTLWDKTL
ncbi:tetratricopeptide repeat-containing diguanylate cyclase [Psychrosphaera saromensis]|uniref:tetratricopeptide repeat-containing diguanylate cyclase n=2 Tax=Psychrosphaera saromensis TaxID=716813 RepID=UPI001E33627B|nr:tetratricopeptide repeat-containing diguanylate cyclase [Psychrosphaera saromensis]